MQIKTRINSKATSALLRKQWQASRRAQTEVAQEIGISQPQLSRLLKGQFTRATENLANLCALFDVKCIYHTQKFSLTRFPLMQRCLTEMLDGTRQRERAIVRLLKSARNFR